MRKIMSTYYNNVSIVVCEHWGKIILKIDGVEYDTKSDESKPYCLCGQINGEPVTVNITNSFWHGRQYVVKVSGVVMKLFDDNPLNKFYNPNIQNMKEIEKTVITEIIKIRCPYCRTLNYDKNQCCTNCGAPL